MLYFSISTLKQGAMKNDISDEVSCVALIIYPRIFGASQNAQNKDIPKSAPNKNKVKTTTKEI